MNNIDIGSLKVSSSEDKYAPDDNFRNDNNIYKSTYKKVDEFALTNSKDYAVHLCTDNSFTTVATGLSNGSVGLYDISAGAITSYNLNYKRQGTICGLRFLDESPNCLLVGTDKELLLFDLRTKKHQMQFDTAFKKLKITCFDRNANSRLLCAGTEKLQDNVYLLFYDIRIQEHMGGYYDSHSDDMTSIRFHPENPDLLCSGSLDGLINVFNIIETSEDDALITTINTEDSVHKLNWHKNMYNKDTISYISESNDFKLFESESGDIINDFKRDDIRDALKRFKSTFCYLIDAHNMENNGVFVLVGTHNDGNELLHSVYLSGKNMLPLSKFYNNNQMVRESAYDIKSKALVAVGEKGDLSIWNINENAHSSYNLKTKTKHNLNRTMPY